MTDRLKVGLVQINYNMNPTRSGLDRNKLRWGSLAPKEHVESEKPILWATLPYTIGLLQVYAQAHSPAPERYEFQLPIYKRIPVDEAVAYLRGADVIAFSVYVWNMQISLAIAKRIKKLRSETTIIFGGPQVPNNAESFLRQHFYIDIVCHGEGEQTFLAILENCNSRKWDGIPSVSYLTPDGSFICHPQAPRMSDLSAIPSPYLEGIFEPLMQSNPQESWTALWETNRGCPYTCTFCDLGVSVDKKLHKFSQERLIKEVEWMVDHRIEGISICDANFGIFPRDVDLTQHIVQLRKEHGYPRRVFYNSAKGATERVYRVQKLLADSRLNAKVVLSLQSTHPTTLKNTKRKNMSFASFREVQRRFLCDGITTCTEMILGLPGDTYASFTNGISQVMESSNIFLYNCLVLQNAEMGDPSYQKRFGLETVLQRVVMTDTSPADEEEVKEFQEIVVATDSMPREDWVKAKIFGWFVDLLYFDRLLIIPLVLMHELYSVSYREMIEAFCQANSVNHPDLHVVASLFEEKAREVQAGGQEYSSSEEWLTNWWPIDQFALIKLVTQGRMAEFYRQATHALETYMATRSSSFNPVLLREAVELNRHMVRMPFNLSNLTMECSYNIWEIYQSALSGESVKSEKQNCYYRIYRTHPIWLSWEDWLEHVVACQNFKDLYLYKICRVEPDEI